MGGVSKKRALYNKLIEMSVEMMPYESYTANDLTNIMAIQVPTSSKEDVNDMMAINEGLSGTEEEDVVLPQVKKDNPDEIKVEDLSKSPKAYVDVDTPLNTILEWDRAKCRLIFKTDSKETFKYLEYEEVKLLSYMNMQAYLVCKAYIEDKLASAEDFDKPLQFREGIPGSAASATSKSKWKDNQNMHRYPARPEEVTAREEMGYVKAGVLTKTAKGEPELIDMAIPKEHYIKHVTKVAKDSHARIKRPSQKTTEIGKRFGKNHGVKNPVTDESDIN